MNCVHNKNTYNENICLNLNIRGKINLIVSERETVKLISYKYVNFTNVIHTKEQENLYFQQIQLIYWPHDFISEAWSFMRCSLSMYFWII